MTRTVGLPLPKCPAGETPSHRGRHVGLPGAGTHRKSAQALRGLGWGANPASSPPRSRCRFPGLKNGENPPKHAPWQIQVAADRQKEGEDKRGQMGMEAEVLVGGTDGQARTPAQSDP